MSSVLLIARMNVVRFVRNKSFFLVAVLAPFLIMAALSATIGPALEGSYRPDLVIADELPAGSLDGFVAGLRDAGFDDLQVVTSAAEARELVDDGSATAAIVYPSELGRAIVDPTAPSAPITIVANAQDDFAADVALDVATSSARTFDTIGALNALGAPTDNLGGEIAVIEGAVVGSRVLTDGTYFAVGMASYFAFFAASGFVATIHRERRESTLARMLGSPISRAAPVLGKGIAAGLAAALSYAILVVASTVLLGADWGPPAGVILIGAALSFAAIGVSMAVVSLTSSEEAAGQVGTVLATGWAIFGGVFLELPTTGLFSSVAKLSPFHWAFRGIGLNAGTGSLAEVGVQALAIAIFGVIGVGIAWLRRNELGRI